MGVMYKGLEAVRVESTRLNLNLLESLFSTCSVSLSLFRLILTFVITDSFTSAIILISAQSQAEQYYHSVPLQQPTGEVGPSTWLYSTARVPPALPHLRPNFRALEPRRLSRYLIIPLHLSEWSANSIQNVNCGTFHY